MGLSEGRYYKGGYWWDSLRGVIIRVVIGGAL